MVMVFNASRYVTAFCHPITQLLVNNEQIVSSSPIVVNARRDPSGETAMVWRSPAGWKTEPFGGEITNFAGNGGV